MVAIVLSASISNLLTKDTIHTLKLRRRGIELRRGRAANLMQVLRASDAMRPVPEGVAPDMPLAELTSRLVDEHRDALPVMDRDGAYRGTVTTQRVEEAMTDNVLDAVAGDLAQTVIPVLVNDSLEHVLGTLVRNDRSGVPVLATAGGPIVGWLTQRDVLLAYHERLQSGAVAAERTRTTATPADSDSPAARISAGGGSADLRGYRIVDLELTHGSAPAGCTVAEVSWPARSRLLAVRRRDRIILPDGSTELRRGDRLTLLVAAEAADSVAETLGSSAAWAPAQQRRHASGKMKESEETD